MIRSLFGGRFSFAQNWRDFYVEYRYTLSGIYGRHDWRRDTDVSFTGRENGR